MTASYPTWTKSEGGRWASWKDKGSNYTYYSVTDGTAGNADFTFDTYFKMRSNLSSLVEGFGIGRNITGGETLTLVDATDDDIVALKIYNGYGNHAAAAANYTMYSLRKGANITYSLSNGSLLMQGTIYRPAPLSVTIGSTGYTTLASPYALDLTKLPDGVTAYYASAVNGSKVVLTEKSDAAVAAGTGLVLKGAAGIYDIPVTVSGSAINGNLLVGCLSAATAWGADKYVLWNDNGVAKFCNLANYTSVSPMTIPAGKAYLDASTAGVKLLSIVFVDESITGVETPTAAEEDGIYYNLNGQQVTRDYKGIVIKNGRKYYNK